MNREKPCPVSLPRFTVVLWVVFVLDVTNVTDRLPVSLFIFLNEFLHCSVGRRMQCNSMIVEKSQH